MRKTNQYKVYCYIVEYHTGIIENIITLSASPYTHTHTHTAHMYTYKRNYPYIGKYKQVREKSREFPVVTLCIAV